MSSSYARAARVHRPSLRVSAALVSPLSIGPPPAAADGGPPCGGSSGVDVLVPERRVTITVGQCGQWSMLGLQHHGVNGVNQQSVTERILG